MKGKLTINGNEYEVEIDNAILDTIVKKPKTGYERVNDTYFFANPINDRMDDIGSDYDMHLFKDNALYENADYYSDANVAKANARADTIMRRLRRFAAEHGGIPNFDHWNNGSITKYAIGYDYTTDNLCYVGRICHRDSVSVYFLSHSAAKQAIELFHDDLLWYFTEYQPMLYQEV